MSFFIFASVYLCVVVVEEFLDKERRTRQFTQAMSLVREERTALPAICEDTKTQAEMAALLDALHDDSNGLPAGVAVQEHADMMLPRIHIRPVVRRRFHSSDLVLRTQSRAAGNGNGVHSPYANRPSGYGFVDSPPVELRRWVLSKVATGNYISNDPDLSELRRYRSQRRTLSDTFTKFVPFDNLGPIEACHDDDEEDDDRNNEEEMIRLLTKSRRPSDEYSVSSASSMYSSPYSSPQSHTRSLGGEQERESYDKLLNLQKLYQEGFITVTEYKDRRLQLVGELSVPERSTYTQVFTCSATPCLHILRGCAIRLCSLMLQLSRRRPI